MDAQALYALVRARSRAIIDFHQAVSIVLVDPNGRAGSGTLVWAARRAFLATAAHVVADVPPARLRVAAHLGQTAPAWRLAGAPVWLDRLHDLAAIPVPGRLLRNLGKRALPLARVAPGPGHFPADLACLAGYPAALAREQGGGAEPVGPIILTTRTRPADPDLPVADLRPVDHLLLEYPESGIWLPGEAYTLPEPGGMSGAGVWRLGLEAGSGWAPEAIRLVGIATSWYRSRRLFKGVRIARWLLLLASRSPALERAVWQHFPHLSTEERSP